MSRMLEQHIRTHGGVATWTQLTADVPPHVVKTAVVSGRLVRLLPRVYADPRRSGERDIRLRAALLFAGPGSALSHLTALEQWPRLRLSREDIVHVMTPIDRDRRSTGFVVVHRHGDRLLPADAVIERNGLPVIRAAPSLVDSWSILPATARRGPVIEAVSIGLVQAPEIGDIARSRASLRGRAELLRLIALLDAGCRSELEILGFRTIFSRARLPKAEWQFSVVIDGHRLVLDVAWPRLLIAVELDGAAYHTSRAARERDLQRDAALTRAGWVVVRLSYRRVLQEPQAIVAELAEIIRTRTAQLGAMP
ncbi:MAG TPA: DUF559 domain-containing protein [Mycobacteriales bacterium]|nr:DUF559 domain-containing protein [Mycobacteriales bacterium]